MAERFDWRGQLRLEDHTQLQVEPFTDADLDAIYQIERRSHTHPWQRVHFVDSLKGSHQHCIGVRNNGQWLAYVVVSCVAGEAELLLLVVDKAWQGRGVAQLLMQHLFAVLRPHADTLFLEVRASNARAIALYELLEFNQVGTRPGYYPLSHSREDALIFARTLD